MSMRTWNLIPDPPQLIVLPLSVPVPPVVVGVAVGMALAPILGPPILGLVGFGPTGVAAGEM